MSILSKISKPESRPVMATILGDAGTGKTTLAATWPKPIFIRAEDGMKSLGDNAPDCFPVIKKTDELWEQLAALISENHEYKTVVIDSVTSLERLFTQHVIDSDPKKPQSINQAMGGWGAGMSQVATMHQRVRKAATILGEAGIGVVFIAHADLEEIDLPDQEPYSRYNLRLGKKSMAHYIDDVDLVAQVKLMTFVQGETSKAISDGSRVICCHAVASSVCKNRFGITQQLDFKPGINPFSEYLK